MVTDSAGVSGKALADTVTVKPLNFQILKDR